MTSFSGATTRFRLNSPSGANIPKPKFMFWVNFVTSQLDTQTLKHLSFFVKKMDRMQLSYDIKEMNQYNKKRLVQGQIGYGPLNFTLHDTVDGTAFKMIEAYNRFYYGDFTNKTDYSWTYDVTGSGFEHIPSWGLKGNQSPNTECFLSRIEVYEMYGATYSRVDFINPRFTAIDMQPLDTSDSAGNEITFGAKYEGVVFKAISEPVTAELANMFGLPLHNDLFSSLLGGLNLPGFDISSGVGLPGQSVFSSLANIAGNLGAINPDSLNIVNSILNGNVPRVLGDNTIFQTINGVYGSTIGGSLPDLISMSSLSNIGNILPDVASRLNIGDTVRDVSSGVFDTAGSFFNDLGF